ncbi:transporter substrate-binding domain-containing protein [Marinomonas sp. 2405UD68-3]|uniref:transporter substrate-binding domain-containing protein n=1 Tax=Marinomonas sp. 2405UD68-3 TaxID=3391835 RepID=UPI0039C8FC82
MKLKSMLKKTFLIAASLAALSTTAMVQADILQDIKDRKILRVAVPQDFPPFGSVGLNLKPQGIDIDVAQYIADKMSVTLELIPVTSANRIPYLQTKKADLVISSLGKNSEREKAIDFSIPYAPFFLGVFGEKGIDVTSVEGLKNKTVGVTRGAVEDLELEKIVSSSTTIQRFEDNNTTLSAYLSGQVSLIATGNLVATEISKRQPNRAPESKFMLKDSPCYIGMMKGEKALQSEVNGIISAAFADGTLNSISMKWLKAPLPKGFGA